MTQINTFQQRYTETFPDFVPLKAAQGFIVTTAISLLAGSAGSVALVGGAIAAAASFIEAITRPIIRDLFRDHQFVAKLIQVCIPQILALGIAASLVPWLAISYKTTSVLLPIIAWISLNEGFYEKNVGVAVVL